MLASLGALAWGTGLKTKAVIVATALLFAADARSAGATTILAKPGATFEIRAADRQRCSDAAEREPGSDMQPARPHPGVIIIGTGSFAAGVGGALATLVINEALAEKDTRESSREATQKCLRYMGYVELPLTAAEAAEYDRLSSSEQTAWEKTFLAGDLSARLNPLTTPRVPPLPFYRDEKGTHGGLKIDTASLAITTADVTGQGDIVAGKAVRWRTAILKTPIDAGDANVRVTAEAGTVFHQVDYRTQYEKLLRNPGATWCGPAMEAAGGQTARNVYCFTTGTEGYDVYRPSGQDWFAGPHSGGFTLPIYGKPIVLEERARDDLGPLGLTITVTAVKKRVVQLKALLWRDGNKVEVWNRALVFNSRGQAVVPLWDRRLWLTHTASDTVRADLTNDGDGTGWRETD
jgi:hypothetical protein